VFLPKDNDARSIFNELYKNRGQWNKSDGAKVSIDDAAEQFVKKYGSSAHFGHKFGDVFKAFAQKGNRAGEKAAKDLVRKLVSEEEAGMSNNLGLSGLGDKDLIEGFTKDLIDAAKKESAVFRKSSVDSGSGDIIPAVTDDLQNQFQQTEGMPAGSRGLVGGLNPRTRLVTGIGSAEGNATIGPAANTSIILRAWRDAWQRGDNNAKIQIAEGVDGNRYRIYYDDIDVSLKKAMTFRRALMNLAVDSEVPLSVNVKNVGKLIANAATKARGMRIEREGPDGKFRLITNEKEAVDLLNEMANPLDTQAAKEAARINRVSQGKEIRKRGKKITRGPIAYDKAMKELITYGKKYLGKDTGNLFLHGMQTVGSQSMRSYKPVVEEFWDRNNMKYSLKNMARFSNPSFTTLRTKWNDWINDSAVRPVLASSGIEAIFAGNQKFRFDDIQYSQLWQLENDVKIINSLGQVHIAAQKARKAGVSDARLAIIRKQIDAFKYNYNQFVSKGDRAKSRNKLFKEDELGWGLNDLEAIRKKDYEFWKKLSSEERLYYDMYMLGSASEQRVHLDDLARAEWVKAINKFKTYDQVQDWLKKPANAARASEINYTWLRQKPESAFYQKVADTAQRNYYERNSTNMPFTLPHVNDNSIRAWMEGYSSIIQFDPAARNRPKRFTDIADPRSSLLIERMLTEDGGQDSPALGPEAIKSFARSALTDSEKAQYEFLYPFFADRPALSAQEAKRAGEQGAYEDTTFGQQFREVVENIEQLSEDGMAPADTEMGKQQRLRVKMLKSIWDHHPGMAKNAVELFESLGITPQESTYADIDRFINHMISSRRRTWIENWFPIDDPTKSVSKLYWFMMPENVGRRLREHDSHLSREKIRPVLTTEGIKNKQVREVQSTYERIVDIMSTAEELHSVIADNIESRIDAAMRFMNHESIEKDRADMIETAVAIRELAGEGNKLMDSLQKELQGFDISAQEAQAIWRDIVVNGKKVEDLEIKNLEGETLKTRRVGKLLQGVENYAENWNNRRSIYDNLKDKNFKFIDDGSDIERTVTGRELMGQLPDGKGAKFEPGIINERFTELNKLFRDSLIDPEGSEKWIVRRPDGSMDPDATLQKLGEQFDGAQRDWERVVNIGLKNMYELSKEIAYKYNTTVPYDNGRDGVINTEVSQITNPKDQERWLSILRANDRGYKLARDEDSGPQRYKLDKQGNIALKPTIRLLRPESYFPHMNHTRKALEDYIKRNYGGKDVEEMTQREVIHLKKRHAEGLLEDAGISSDIIDDLFAQKEFSSTDNRTATNPYGNLAGRSDAVMKGYDMTEGAYKQYARALSKTYHNLYGVVTSKALIRNFRRNEKMGDMTEAWASFMDIHVQDFTGKPSVFPDKYLDVPGLNFKRSPYYMVSDEAAQNGYFRAADFLGIGNEARAESEGNKVQFQNRLRWWTRLEGKMSLLTLLANTRSMVNNYVGGTAMTVISSGWNSFKRANDTGYIRDNVDSRLDTRIKQYQFAVDGGAIESYIKNEVGKAYGANASVRRATNEIIAKIKSDPKVAKETLMEIAKRNGVLDTFTRFGSSFMSTVERELRVKSWWAHYLNARDSLMMSRGDVAVDDPWLIKMAQKGVWGTQFLYNNANRPAIARTSLGRVFSRFQLWSWNSIKFRRDIYGEAARMGFRPDTPEMDRFKRMAQADTFMFALATALPMTMFESVLPSPWNYVQDFSDYFFGDEDERDKAFFGTIPYPFNPIQGVLPPSSRYAITPIQAAIAFFSDEDAQANLDYRVMSMLPFGLLARNVYRSAKNPVMAGEFMTGIPFSRVGRMVKKERTKATRYYNGLYAPGTDETTQEE